MKKLLQRYMQYWQIGLAVALSVIAIVLSVFAITTQRDGTLDPVVEASILSSGRAASAETTDAVGGVSAGTTTGTTPSSTVKVSAESSSAALSQAASSTSGVGGSTGGSARPTAVFIGDGYTAGADSTTPDKRWTSLVSARLGWTEVNLGFAGTGYLKTGSARANYIASLPDVVAATPAVVVVSGGRNDVDEPEDAEKLAITTFFSELRAAVPGATIVVLNPVWDDDPLPAGITAIAADLETAAAATTGVRFLDIGQPLVGRTDLINDGTDPNDAGHLALADATVTALNAAGITG